jgi:hypothetical protein
MDMNTALIPIVGMTIPIVLVPVGLAMKHARIERELEHAERMKALELGRTLPHDESWWSPARISAAIGVGVPIGVFFCAWQVSSSGMEQTPAVWVSAGLVGLAGVVCGSLLANRHFARTEAAQRAVDRYLDKPDVDADAFDVVGSRG